MLSFSIENCCCSRLFITLFLSSELVTILLNIKRGCFQTSCTLRQRYTKMLWSLCIIYINVLALFLLDVLCALGWGNSPFSYSVERNVKGSAKGETATWNVGASFCPYTFFRLALDEKKKGALAVYIHSKSWFSLAHKLKYKPTYADAVRYW